ncbi:hypothetical protein ACLB2K_035416 [Fragaria x ananassa]
MLSKYDGLSKVTTVLISSMPMWVEILGLPPRLFTEEAAGKVGDLLGQVLFMDKIGLRRGIRANVRLIHDISDPVREAFPPMPFEFDLGDWKATVMLSFKYERLVGFCRVCGLLEHLSQGCGSPPDATKVQQVSLVPAAEVEKDILGFGRFPVTKNPNPSFRQGVGLNRVCLNPSPASVNPFSGGALSALSSSSSSSQPGSFFSIPGVSASELARQLASFKSPFLTFLPAVGKDSVGLLVIQIPAAVYNPIIRVQRDADLTLIPMGKRAQSDDAPMEVQPGKAGANSRGPRKAKKRSFGAHRVLEMGETSGGSTGMSDQSGVVIEAIKDVVVAANSSDFVSESGEIPSA